jgi:hypothetical protein
MPRTQLILKDHHGPWCAYCLQYFAGGVEEGHHVYPEWSTAGSPAATVFAWTIPVHRKGCHRKGLQRRSDAAGLALNDVLARPDGVLRRAAETAFYSGNLNLCFVLELELARRAKGSGNFEASCDHLLNAVASAAGSSLGSVHRALMNLNPEETIARASVPVQARWALSFGNLERNFYQIQSAAARYEEASTRLESLSTSARNLYRPAYLRRMVSLKPSVSGAREAVDLARATRHPWGQRTADIVEGWSNLAVGLVPRARDSFSRVFWDSPRFPLSWWHVAEAHFGLGLSYVVGGDDLRTGLGHCLRSQYIKAVLALGGDVVVGVGLGRSRLDSGLGPSEVIATVCKSKARSFGRHQMMALRTEFLDADLQEALFKELRVGGALHLAV